MSALISSNTKKVILFGCIDNMQICKTSLPGISIQVYMPDIMRRRITKALNQVQTNSSIPSTEKQHQFQSILESFYRDFVLLRDIISTHSGNQVEFICIGLNADVIQLIQIVYPPSHCALVNIISYDIIQSVDDAITKYGEYLKILSPPSSVSSSDASSVSSSAASSPHPVLSIFDDQISTIPFPNHCGRIIYLGSDNGANNFAKLSELGITHILNVSDCIPNYYESSTNITYMRIPIADCGSVILKDYFPTVFEFINNALESDGRVLVHCFAGKSRSASFVIAYLMQYEKMNYMDAFKHVQSHREVVDPNLGFLLQLHAFEKSIHPNA